MPADDHLAIETKTARRSVACAGRVGGAQRESVDIGAIERRQIDLPDEACMRFFGGDHFEELLLARSAADLCDQIALGGFRFDTRSHDQGLITASLPGGCPSLSEK